MAVIGEEELYTDAGLVIDALNSILVAGEARGLHVSQNGQFVWTVVRRRRWELASHARLAELCTPEATEEGEGSSDPFLAAMRAQACVGLEALGDGDSGVGGDASILRVGLHLFAWEATACPALALCPGFRAEEVYPAEVLSSGLYTTRAYAFAICPEGYFCVAGQKIRCPQASAATAPGCVGPNDAWVGDGEAPTT